MIFTTNDPGSNKLDASLRWHDQVQSKCANSLHPHKRIDGIGLGTVDSDFENAPVALGFDRGGHRLLRQNAKVGKEGW